MVSIPRLTVADAFAMQAAYCRANDAPVTAAVLDATIGAIDRASATGAAILDWPGHAVADALPLRIAGGLHDLWRSGEEPGLDPLFRDGRPVDLLSVIARHDARLARWLDGPPQTNEPGRCAQLMTGLAMIAARHGPALSLREIGSVAGLNLNIGWYRIILDGLTTGPANSPVTIAPNWRGPPAGGVAPALIDARGCDIAPLDATDPADTARLRAYVWVDHGARFALLDAAIGVARAHPPRVDRADAADWVDARLAEPQTAGTTRVLMHSIVWTYLPPATRDRITAAMASAARRATAARPLAWLAVEADKTVHKHVVTLRSWPGHDAPVRLALAHAHGFWVDRL